MGKKVRKLWANRPHPFKALKKWARTPDSPRSKSKRFGQLKLWARKMRSKVRAKARDAWDHRQKKYRRKQRYFRRKADRRAEKKAKDPKSGIVTFDGVAVTADWARILATCRASGLWGGTLRSGWRDPAYSESLCYRICGRPYCSGTCAGRSSNHSKLTISSGAAVDVSDPSGFRQALIRIGHAELHNALGAADPWHFSITGR